MTTNTTLANIAAVVGATAVFSSAMFGEQTQVDFQVSSNASPADMIVFLVVPAGRSDSAPTIGPPPIYLLVSPTIVTQGTIAIVGTNLSDVGAQVSSQNPSLIPVFNGNVNISHGGFDQTVPSINFIGSQNTFIVRGWI